MLALALIACEEVVDPKKLGLQEKLIVVNGLISPQLPVLEVEVSWSRPIFGPQPDFGSREDFITDAEVVMSNGQNRVTLTYDPDRFRYSLDASLFPIQSGETYDLEVTVGDKTVTSSATVPDAVAAQSFSISAGNNDSKRATISWDDPVGTGNFYRVNAILLNEQGQEEASIFFDTDEYQSDTNRDGARITARGETYFFGDIPAFSKVKSLLISCDENYYNYYKDFDLFENDDPFSEAVQTRSNIAGGVGIFAAFQLTETEISAGG